MTSSTYRQQSRHREDLANIDPQNRLLARQSRLRLEAEIIRDEALFVSGLLNDAMGGPTVFPYQADGIMEGRADKTKWKMSEGADRFRRGMYIHYWRLTPHPYLRTFDAPDASESCTRRLRSNTPIQAVTLLNHPWFTEFAVALADRVLREVPGEDAARIDSMFGRCLARPPQPRESEVLHEVLARLRESYQAEPERVEELLTSVDIPLRGDRQEIAVWTGVSRTLLNCDEFITRE